MTRIQSIRRQILSVLLITTMVVSGIWVAAPETADAATETIYTATLTSDKNLLLPWEGTYQAEIKDQVLELINNERKAACEAGNVPDPRNKTRMLTADDYVPIKWSTELEEIARVRAAEISIFFDHTRTNNTKWSVLRSSNGASASGECLAYSGAWGSSAQSQLQSGQRTERAFKSYYSEKEAWLNQTPNVVTGHYTSMINPNNVYVGWAEFSPSINQEDDMQYFFNAAEYAKVSFLNGKTSQDEIEKSTEPVKLVLEVQKVGVSIADNTKDTVLAGKTMTLVAKIGLKSDTYQDEPWLTVTTDDELYQSAVTWTSSDTSIATVNEAGVVTGVAAGTATITVTAGDYTDTFEITVIDIREEQQAAKSEISSYKNLDDFRVEEQEEIAQIIADANEKIDAAESVEEINAIVDAAKSELDAVKTDAELTAEELAAAKESAKTELASYVNPANYRSAEQREIASILTDAETKIDAATVIDEIAPIVADAKANLDKVKTDAELTAEELAAAKVEAVAEIGSYVDKNEYRAAEQREIDTIIADANTRIDEAINISEIQPIVDAAKESLDALKTDTELTKEELNAAKESAKAELASYVDPANYRSAEQREIASILTDAETKIDAATAIDEIEPIVADAKAALDKVKTDAELTAEELVAAKAEATDAIKNYVDKNEYREAEQQQITDIVENAVDAIEEAETKDEVDTIVEKAKAELDAVKTDAELAAEELNAAKESAKAELASYVDPANYRSAEQREIASILTDAETKIDAATVIDEIAPIVADAKAALDKVKTDAELTAEELVAAKAEAIDAIKNYADKNKYREAEQQQITDIVEKAVESIENAETKDEVNTILENAKAEIDKLKTDAQLTEEENGPEINRIAGKNRYETSMMIADQLKEELGVERFDAVVIASGMGFADALAGTYLADKLDAPILLVSDPFIPQITDYIKENVTPGGKIYILGGTGAVSEKMEPALDGYVVKRLAGSNRYLTNIEILKEAGVTGGDLAVANGLAYADALSVSAAGVPVLLVGADLMPEQQAYLDTLKDVNFIAIGGEGAVNAKVYSKLATMGEVERAAGINRYETSIAVAERFFGEGIQRKIVLTYGLNYPDGLCGGVLASKTGAPIILVTNNNYSYAVDYAKKHSSTKATILGGQTLISDAVAKAITEQ